MNEESSEKKNITLPHMHSSLEMVTRRVQIGNIYISNTICSYSVLYRWERDIFVGRERVKRLRFVN